MSRRQGFLLCVFTALSTVLLAFDGKAPAAPAGTSSTDTAVERGVPALFSWGDVNGDGRLDLAAVGVEGKLQLLVNAGEGRFEDVTERLGLCEVGNAALALWADYDGDGRLDLFVGAREGASRLFHNVDGIFVDISAASGLSSEGAVQSAQWLDHDGDGRLDLFVVTAEKNELFRGLEGGFFEVAELPLAVSTRAPSAQEAPVDSRVVSGEGTARELSDLDRERDGPYTRGSVPPRPRASGSTAATVTSATSAGPHAAVGPPNCFPGIMDQAMPANCLEASTTPTLGKLYPISANLFVATGGNVGIGTTSPAAKLDVAGTARMTGTLTLSPGVDQALDVSTGSIYKGGALFIHTKGGTNNTALGREALVSVTTGSSNTASGYRALFSNTTGYENTATGNEALFSNTTGYRNTATGHRALFSNTYGYYNTATGNEALRSNTTGYRNTATGYRALSSNTTGISNTASGYWALRSNTTGNQNTATGNEALLSNTTGVRNTASGYQALVSNTTGNSNTASGFEALVSNTTGNSNTVSGYQALSSNTTGVRNIALGSFSGASLTTGNDNIAIGNFGVAAEANTIRIGNAALHTRAFISGIHGVTTFNANAIPVLVDSAGQLGTVSSSRRFKKDIADMGDLTERLLELRPVVFRYKQDQKVPSGEVPLEYGLIAEEVAEIFPDLVVYDEEGVPFTVRYHVLSSMLLNELKKLHERLEAQSGAHAREMEELRSRLVALETRTSPVTLPIPSDSR